jgi:hypothetical protein
MKQETGKQGEQRERCISCPVGPNLAGTNPNYGTPCFDDCIPNWKEVWEQQTGIQSQTKK